METSLYTFQLKHSQLFSFLCILWGLWCFFHNNFFFLIVWFLWVCVDKLCGLLCFIRPSLYFLPLSHHEAYHRFPLFISYLFGSTVVCRIFLNLIPSFWYNTTTVFLVLSWYLTKLLHQKKRIFFPWSFCIKVCTCLCTCLVAPFL